METSRIIAGSISSLIAFALGIYVSFTFRGKGSIFSNTYLWLSKEEQKKADKKAEYKLVSVIFSCLAGVFVLLALYSFTLWSWAYILMWVVIAFTIIYAIADTVKTLRKERKS